MTDKTYPYPVNSGQTHWQGCWRAVGHHNCAVAEVDEARRWARRMYKANESLRVEYSKALDLLCDLTGEGKDEYLATHITDGFGEWWDALCPKCGGAMTIIRPGDARCGKCEN